MSSPPTPTHVLVEWKVSLYTEQEGFVIVEVWYRDLAALELMYYKQFDAVEATQVLDQFTDWATHENMVFV